MRAETLASGIKGKRLTYRRFAIAHLMDWPMITPAQQTARHLYMELMEEAKLRLFSIQFAVQGRTGIPQPFIREFSYLQLRMLCELIALSSLVAHGDIRETKSKSVQEKWAAGEIIGTLDNLHPNFYPRPLVFKGGADRTHEFDDMRSGFLTKEKLKTLNGRCGEIVHRGIARTLRPIDRDAKLDLSDVVKWTDEITALLKVHLISLIDGETHYLCLLVRGKDDDRVQLSVAKGAGPPPPTTTHQGSQK